MSDKEYIKLSSVSAGKSTEAFFAVLGLHDFRTNVVEDENVRVKIRGDAGIYNVWGVDLYNHRVLVSRACGVEWVDIGKITLFKKRID